MDMLDVLDADGNPTGVVKSKDQIHADGDWHGCAHVWILNARNQVLLQRRAAHKVNYPNYWDLSVAGHIDAGETPRIAAIREAQEELGLTLAPDELEPFAVFKEEEVLNGGTFIENVMVHAYIVRRDLDIATLILSPREVAEVRFLDLEEFSSWVEEPKPDLALPDREEYLRLIELAR